MSEFQPVLLTLPDARIQPSLAVEVLPYGFTIHKFVVQADGRTHDIVIGPETPTDHKTQKYTNSIVGRYANRIPVGTHVLERKGFTSELNTQANESPAVSLHGGPVGFDALPWSVVTDEEPATLFSAAELDQIKALDASSYAIFRLRSPSGDQGYPGTLLTEAFIGLVPPTKAHLEERSSGSAGAEYSLGSLVLIYRAKLEEPNLVTPVNLTQHWGFNLGASLRDEVPDSLSVKDHILSIKSDHIAELASNSLGTGKYIPVTAAPAHAHDSKAIGHQMPPSGYDDYYLFEEKASSSIPTRIPLSSFSDASNFVEDLLRASDDKARGARAEPTVVLASNKSGLKVLFDSNQHGAMFYTNSLASASKGARKKIHGGAGIRDNGDAYGPGTAAFIEFHHPLAAFLEPKNHDREDTLLTSAELYHNYVRCDVKFEATNQAAH